MPPFASAYLGCFVVMLVLDVIWLGLMVPRVYQPMLGGILAETPKFWVAGVFYLVYIVGVVAFCVLPAAGQGSWLVAAGAGALLGLVAYGTYDFTNLSTVRGWPALLTAIDVAWGMVLTAATATGGYFAVRWLSPGA